MDIPDNWMEKYLIKKGEPTFLLLILLTLSVTQLIYLFFTFSKKIYKGAIKSFYSSSLVKSKHVYILLIQKIN